MIQKNSCYLSICLFMALISCDSKVRLTKSTEIKADSCMINSTVKYAELRKVMSRKEDFLSNLADVMKLPSMNSADSYVRIWIWDDTVKYVVNIFEVSENRKATIFSFNSEITDTGEIIKIHKNWEIYNPKNGWKALDKVILDNQIMTLPNGRDMEDLPKIPTHGSWIQFEVTKNGKYRYYEYFQPDFYRNVDLSSRFVYTFLSYLREVFSIDFFKTNDKFVLDS